MDQLDDTPQEDPQPADKRELSLAQQAMLEMPTPRSVMLADGPAIRVAAARMQLARTLMMLHPPSISPPRGAGAAGAAPDGVMPDEAFAIAKAAVARMLHEHAPGSHPGASTPRAPGEPTSPGGLPPGFDNGIYRPDAEGPGPIFDEAVLRWPAAPDGQMTPPDDFAERHIAFLAADDPPWTAGTSGLPTSDVGAGFGSGLQDEVAASVLPVDNLTSSPLLSAGSGLEPLGLIRPPGGAPGEAISSRSSMGVASAALSARHGASAPLPGTPAVNQSVLQPPKIEVTLVDAKQSVETAFHEAAAQIAASIDQRMGSELHKAAATRQANWRTVR